MIQLAAVQESAVGTFETSQFALEMCPFIGLDRKWLGPRQTGAIDPERTLAAQTAFAAKLSHSPHLLPLRQSGYGMFIQLSN